ncbi:hypothetical protein EXIGLDRAFT_736886 [Exidia glandulosa HHB12029]|uniref:Uncharacterized protein n=1 Tax=Exidia glandulosa HHB12029 TaxID=1314781 RepID=A0A165J944_EXIGL|nr:hypothetical protein EXIGLDRAFT_736886 [Exidia glandulosa HHB12029]
MPKDTAKEDTFTKAQKRKLAGYKAVLAKETSTEEAKANARKMIEQIEKDEKFETVGDRVAGRERNKAQEAKDEKFETIGDRVRARTELGGGLGETKSPKRIVAGLKASLKNPNTSAEKKKELREKLRELGEDVPEPDTVDEPTDTKMKDVEPAADKEADKEEEKAAEVAVAA